MFHSLFKLPMRRIASLRSSPVCHTALHPATALPRSSVRFKSLRYIMFALHVFVLTSWCFDFTVNTTMTDKCKICEKDVTSDHCKVLQKGIQGLIKASKSVESIVVHGACRNLHTRNSSIIADVRKPRPSTSLASTSSLYSSQQLFEINSQRLFSTEKIDKGFYAKETKKNLKNDV